MSLILEALKKSEQQRQREKAPNLQSIHQPFTVGAKKSTKRWWMIVAVLIVACNLAFFGYWFWQQQHNAASVAQAPSAAAADTAQPAVKIEKGEQPIAGSSETQDTQPEFTQISPHSQAQPIPVEPAQRIEEVNELPDSVRNNLPAMTFSFHVYSDSPEQRAIIINDRRMHEGDQVAAGLKLQSITQDGVVLLFEQHRIHISVLSDW